MALTRSFKGLPRKQVASDPAFRETLLREGGEKPGEQTGTRSRSLIRMFGPSGNPQARNLSGVVGDLQKQAGVVLRVTRHAG